MPEQERLPDVRTTTQAWESLFRTQVAVMRRLQGLPEFKKLSQAGGCVGYMVWLAGRHVTYYGRRGETHVELFPD